MENIITEISMYRQYIKDEYIKENPDHRKISFYESLIRSLKESLVD